MAHSPYDLDRLLTTQDALACMALLYRQLSQSGASQSAGVRYDTPPRSVLPLPAAPGHKKIFGLMPSVMTRADAAETVYFGVKCLSVFAGPKGAGGGHKGVYVLFDGKDGHHVASYDAETMTAIRTAASSAIAARALLPHGLRARPLRVGLVGTGEQARRHAASLVAMFPMGGPGAWVARVDIWGRDTARTAQCVAACAHLGAPGVAYGAAATIAELVAECDIVCTLTAASEPIVFGRHLDERKLEQPLVLLAVGACQKHNRELDEGIVSRSALPIVVDTIEGAMREAGDLLAPDALAALGCDEASLAECLVPLSAIAESGYGLSSAAQRGCVLFKSVGFGAQDLALAVAAHEIVTKGNK